MTTVRSAKTAVCLTPDLAFFRQAVCTASSILAQEDSGAFDVFIVCEESDVAPGFAALDPILRNKIRLLCVDFSTFDRGAPGRGRLSRAVFRRLFLDRILPESYERIVSIDSDMLIQRAAVEIHQKDHVIGGGDRRPAKVDLGEAAEARASDQHIGID